MQICLIGTPSCGKSTFITLLHLTANEMLMDEKRYFIAKKFGYRSRGTKDGGLDLDLMADKLKNGFPVPATLPSEGVRQALMMFSFRNWFFRNRELAISAVDSGGGLQQELFELLPEGLMWDDNAFDKIRIRTRVTKQEYEQFISTIFNSEAYLFIVDAQKALEQSGTQDGARQDRSLSTFIRSLHAYKELKVESTPKLKGFGILLTRIDKVPELMNNGLDIENDKLESYVNRRLGLGRAALQSLCNDFKIKPLIFYHLLSETKGFGNNQGAQWYEINEDTGSIRYPKVQYENIINWFKKLAEKRFDNLGR